MGVKSCSRKNCGSPMCDIYIPKIGYVCDDCKREFKTYLEENNLEPKTDKEIETELEKFMGTNKGQHLPGKIMSVDDFFNEHSH